MPGSPALWAGSFNQNIRTVPKTYFASTYLHKLREHSSSPIEPLSAKKRRFIPFYEAVNYQPNQNRLLETTT
jgi:hypothetical protein